MENLNPQTITFFSLDSFGCFHTFGRCSSVTSINDVGIPETTIHFHFSFMRQLKSTFNDIYYLLVSVAAIKHNKKNNSKAQIDHSEKTVNLEVDSSCPLCSHFVNYPRAMFFFSSLYDPRFNSDARLRSASTVFYAGKMNLSAEIYRTWVSCRFVFQYKWFICSKYRQ